MALLQGFEPGRGVHARRIGADDEAFLRTLYASTRAHEVAATGWPAARQQAFLDEQFGFQRRYYDEHFDAPDLMLLQHGNRPIGRLLWHDRPGAATLIDVSLLPAWRGCGLGTQILASLCARADLRGASIGLHVEPDNPARRLYERFGFGVVGDGGVYLKMRRTPQ